MTKSAPLDKAAPPKPTPSKLMSEIARILSAREDIELYENTGTRISGVQIRRIWRHHVHNPDSMSPHERFFWDYHGQAFFIEEPQYKKTEDGKEELIKRQRDFANRYGRVGAAVIFPKSLDGVFNVLGSQPQDIEEYIKRQQHKTVAPSRQPTPYAPGGA